MSFAFSYVDRILPLVLYGCETWSLALREERRLTFGPKRDEVTGEWMRLHNEELRDLYSSPNYSGDQIKKEL
jgi:hypothetical protein